MKMGKRKLLSLILTAFVAFSACACFGTSEGASSSSSSSSSSGIPDVVPAGYTAEVGDVMFWEKEDTVLENTVVPDVDIRIYNYAPTILQKDEKTRYVYYCSNKYTDPDDRGKDIDGDDFVTDYVAYREGKKCNGIWYWSPKQYLMGPTLGSPTEGEHACDPNVIKGKFVYDGRTYGYLMAYLACNTRDNQYNHVCVAVAREPSGPWVKCDKINPLIKYTSDDVPAEMKKTYLWGYGQASMISVDKKGRVLMLYSAIKPFHDTVNDTWAHNTVTSIARWDLSNLNQPKQEFLVEKMGVTGIKNVFERGKYFQAEAITNGDYAYDPVNNRIYGMFDGRYNANEKVAAGGTLAWVENKAKSQNGEIGDVFRDYDRKLWGQTNQPVWTTVAHAKSDNLTNYIHAHNTAVIRDEYGWLYDPQNVEVAVTGALTEDTYPVVYPDAEDSNYIWSYRIIRKKIALS